MNKITTINDRIEKLRKQKAKIQTQQAILFVKEAEKIFKEGFSPDIALAVLSDWATAPEAKKKEWTNKANYFRPDSVQGIQRKTETRDTDTHQNGKAQATENG